MPITYYDTVNGQLIGETTSGVRTEYLTDALGSVSATVNSSGEIVNTYRYKPYGQLLAKTGSGEDPRYLWTGNTGSRRTLVTYAEQYNQARHYGARQAGWTTVDPLWPTQLMFGYVWGNPTNYTDPSGLAYVPSRQRKSKKDIDVCGGFAYKWTFAVSGKPTGWLIQHVTREIKATSCDLYNIHPYPPECTVGTGSLDRMDYFEAWRVVMGVVYAPGNSRGTWGPGLALDTWASQSNKCSYGVETIQGSLMFIEDPFSVYNAGFREDSNRCAGALPATFKFTNFKSQGGYTKVSSSWGCCKLWAGCSPPTGNKCDNSCREGPCETPRLMP